MRKFMGTMIIVLAAVLYAGSAQAFTVEYGSEDGVPYSRDLVEKVKKSVIAIWIFGDNGMALGSQGIGSGVIFQAVPEENAAYALTNHHVAGDSALLQCETWDRSTFKAQLVATEPGIDAALIKIFDIPADAYEPCILGDSDQVQPGDLALAMGAPGTRLNVNSDRSDPMIDFGLHLTATMRGVLGKQYDHYGDIGTWGAWRSNQGSMIMVNCPWRIVTQTAVNGGNSGGPLFNGQGECIGLNHASWNAPTDLAQDISITIPISFCKNFAFQILQTGKYELPWVGLDVLLPPSFYHNKPQGVSSSVAEFQERYLKDGVVEVYEVRHNSPAERAGFELGDRIIEFDGIEFESGQDLRSYIFTLPIGRQVPVIVERELEPGKFGTVEFSVEIGVKRSYDSDFSA